MVYTDFQFLGYTDLDFSYYYIVYVGNWFYSRITFNSIHWKLFLAYSDYLSYVESLSYNTLITDTFHMLEVVLVIQWFNVCDGSSHKCDRDQSLLFLNKEANLDLYALSWAIIFDIVGTYGIRLMALRLTNNHMAGFCDIFFCD